MRIAAVPFIIASALAACVPSTFAQVGGVAPGAAPAEPDLSIRTLAVSAAPEPVPALRFRLRFNPADELGGNAAIGYLQVVGAPMISPEVFNRAVDLLAAKPEEMSTTEAQQVVDETFGGVWDLLVTAARRDTCRWETPIKDQGVGVLLPELGRFRQLARIVVLKARIEIRAGKFDEAVKTIRCGLELGQDIGRGPTLIQALVGVAIVQLMFEQIEYLIQQPGAPNLYWALTELPSPIIPMGEAIRNEQAVLDYTVPEIRELESGAITPAAAADASARVNMRLGSLRTEFGMVNPDAGARLEAAATAVVQYPKASQWLVTQGYTPEQVQALPVSYVTLRHSLWQFRRVSDDFVKWCSLPYPQASAGLSNAESELDRIARGSEAQPFIMLLPAVNRAMLSGAMLDRRNAMLRGVEAIRMHAAAHGGALPARLNELSATPIPADPVTGEAFTYKLEGDTAVLSVASIQPNNSKAQPREYRIRIVPVPERKPAP